MGRRKPIPSRATLSGRPSTLWKLLVSSRTSTTGETRLVAEAVGCEYSYAATANQAGVKRTRIAPSTIRRRPRTSSRVFREFWLVGSEFIASLVEDVMPSL